MRFKPQFIPDHAICGPSLDPPDDDRIDTCECGNDKDARDEDCDACDEREREWESLLWLYGRGEGRR